jgi:hypothetical protein
MREVLYPLHPWAGRQVEIHEVVDKSGRVVFRCSQVNSASSRWSEIPAWMFERAVCVTVRFGTAPRVNIDALRVLARLLRDAIPISIAQDLSAALGSHDSDRRVAHAKPAKTTVDHLARNRGSFARQLRSLRARRPFSGGRRAGVGLIDL